MIQRVSGVIQNSSFKGIKRVKNAPKTQEDIQKEAYRKSYIDSFVKHAKESTPIMLGLTALWTVLDHGTKNVSVQKALLNNLATFFIPVVAGSSAILAGIENKKTSKSSNS